MLPSPPASPSLQDQRLRDALNALQGGLNAESVQQEEASWTRIIEEYEGLEAPWVPDIVSAGAGKTTQGGGDEAQHLQASSIEAYLSILALQCDHKHRLWGHLQRRS